MTEVMSIRTEVAVLGLAVIFAVARAKPITHIWQGPLGERTIIQDDTVIDPIAGGPVGQYHSIVSNNPAGGAYMMSSSGSGPVVLQPMAPMTPMKWWPSIFDNQPAVGAGGWQWWPSIMH